MVVTIHSRLIYKIKNEEKISLWSCNSVHTYSQSMLNLRDRLKEAFYKQNIPNYLHSKNNTYPVCFYRSTGQLLLYIFFLWLATVFMMHEQKMKLDLTGFYIIIRNRKHVITLLIKMLIIATLFLSMPKISDQATEKLIIFGNSLTLWMQNCWDLTKTWHEKGLANEKVVKLAKLFMMKWCCSSMMKKMNFYFNFILDGLLSYNMWALSETKSYYW